MARRNRIQWGEMDKTRSDVALALQALQQAKALKSARTLQWYRSHVGDFRAWLVETGYPTTLADITPEIVREYLSEEGARRYKVAYRRRKNPETGLFEQYRVELPGRLSEHSLNSKIRCLRAFGRWLVREGWLEASPFDGLELAGAPKLRKKVLSEDEINHLFSLLNDKTDIGARDKAILWLFLDTGIRLSELATLSLDRVNLTYQDDGPWVQVIGKDLSLLRENGLSRTLRESPFSLSSDRAERRDSGIGALLRQDQHVLGAVDVPRNYGRPLTRRRSEAALPQLDTDAALPGLGALHQPPVGTKYPGGRAHQARRR